MYSLASSSHGPNSFRENVFPQDLNATTSFIAACDRSRICSSVAVLGSSGSSYALPGSSCSGPAAASTSSDVVFGAISVDITEMQSVTAGLLIVSVMGRTVGMNVTPGGRGLSVGVGSIDVQPTSATAANIAMAAVVRIRDEVMLLKLGTVELTTAST